jgi:glutathione S-transferase
MRLYSAQISPFAGRVRAALYYKGLTVDVVAPPAAGLKSPEFLALNPMGKIPLLMLDDGSSVPESEAILEYLEDAYPERALRPVAPERRAFMRTAIRVNENYVTPPTVRLFPHLNPATRDPAVVADEVARLKTGLQYLSHYVGKGPYVVDDKLSLADCCVFPSLHLCSIVAAQLGMDDLFVATPQLARYFANARSDPFLKRVHDEVESALAQHNGA